MVSRGQLCQSCGAGCLRDDEKQDGRLEITCTSCGGSGCKRCKDKGSFQLDECPRKFVGAKLTSMINLASFCTDRGWPVNGGLLDQASWFVSLSQMWNAEQKRLDSEEIERIKQKANRGK